jgi:thiol-disulfide isomerase/thioredoxin
MKRNIFLPFVLLFALLTALSAQAQIAFPPFVFQDLSGAPFSADQLDPNKPTFVMYFDPYCDHCDHQAEWIAGAAEQFEDVQLVFVTLEPETEAIEAFRQRHFGKVDLPYLYFLQDTEFRFEEFFGYTDDAVNIYLYSPGRKQAKYFGEEQEAGVLLKFL